MAGSSALPFTAGNSPRSAGTLYRKREQQPWPRDRTFRILAIDGGGIRGLLPLAILRAVEKNILNGASVADHFDLITGASTGGIIALGLAAGRTATEIFDCYYQDGQRVFPPAKWWQKATRGLTQVGIHQYNEVALNELLTAVLGDLTLADARTRLCIPSFEGTHGEVFIYKTAHHPDYKKDWRQEMRSVGRATSAAPTYFRPLVHEGWKLVDGGVWANNPIMIGLVDALACFDVGRDQIEILSLGCMDERYIVGDAQMKWGGMWNWRKIVFAAMSLASQNAIGQAGLLIGRDQVLRIDTRMPSPPIELDDWSMSCRLLPKIGNDLFITYREALSERFFADKAEPFCSIYTLGQMPS
jgi:hypothetical protein